MQSQDDGPRPEGQPHTSDLDRAAFTELRDSTWSNPDIIDLDRAAFTALRDSTWSQPDHGDLDDAAREALRREGTDLDDAAREALRRDDADLDDAARLALRPDGGDLDDAAWEALRDSSSSESEDGDSTVAGMNAVWRDLAGYVSDQQSPQSADLVNADDSSAHAPPDLGAGTDTTDGASALGADGGAELDSQAGAGAGEPVRHDGGPDIPAFDNSAFADAWDISGGSFENVMPERNAEGHAGSGASADSFPDHADSWASGDAGADWSGSGWDSWSDETGGWDAGADNGWDPGGGFDSGGGDFGGGY